MGLCPKPRQGTDVPWIPRTGLLGRGITEIAVDRLRHAPFPANQIGGGQGATGSLRGLGQSPMLVSHPGGAKLCTRLPATRRQPSTRTKKISLNGSDTALGGSIIMPRLMSTDETTMSITRNGK